MGGQDSSSALPRGVHRLQVSTSRNDCCVYVMTSVFDATRPVPLQHFVFPSGAEGLYLVVDEKSKFREDNFQRAMACLRAPSELDDVGGKKKKQGGGPHKGGPNSDLFKIVRYVD